MLFYLIIIGREPLHD